MTVKDDGTRNTLELMQVRVWRVVGIRMLSTSVALSALVGTAIAFTTFNQVWKESLQRRMTDATNRVVEQTRLEDEQLSAPVGALPA